jgi:hypothetical protein
MEHISLETVKVALTPLMSWTPLKEPKDGFSIILCVPWDLRHLLHVNLRFVEKTDLNSVRQIFVVFDRCKLPEMEAIESRTRQVFPQLPLEFLHYPLLSGKCIEKIHVSRFFIGRSATLALKKCETQYAIFHDFDLYPLVDDHFTSIVGSLTKNHWHFCGHELTHHDGLLDEDLQIGTWTLGMDVQWLRNQYRPIDCFHRIYRKDNQVFDLDPFAWLQFQTDRRGLVPKSSDLPFCHVKNLCSTYLRFLRGESFNYGWRLHYLWYLEDRSGKSGRIAEVTTAMETCQDDVLNIDSRMAPFQRVHASCVNVLRNELFAMDAFLFGRAQDDTKDYLDAFARFLLKFGDVSEIRDSENNLCWSRDSISIP